MTDTTRRIDIEELLTHREWLRWLARHLVADRQLAEDVEQDVWEQALRKPPRHSSSLRGWLARAFRSRLSDRVRSETARTRRQQRVSNREAQPSTGDLVAAADAHRRVAAAVTRMREPYRTAILLRYYEELSVRDVALRMDAPYETTRYRLRQAIGMLRRDVDESLGSTEARDRRGLLILAGLPWSGDAAARGFALAKGAVMTTKTKLVAAAAIAAALVLGFGVWSSGERGSIDLAEAPVVAGVSEADVDVSDAREPAAEDAPTPGSTLASGAASVRGVVARRSTDSVAAGVTVTLTCGPDVRSVTTGVDGGFRFASLPAGGPYSVRVEEKPFAEVRIEGVFLDVTERRDLGTLLLAAPAELLVSVVDDLGEPIPAATVEAFRIERGAGAQDRWWRRIAGRAAGPIPVSGAVTGDDGVAIVPSLAAGHWTVVARRRGFASAGSVDLDVPAGRTVPLRVVLGRGFQLRGRVTDADGRVVAGAAVVVGWGRDSYEMAREPLLHRSVSDATGEYVLEDLSPGTLSVFAGLGGRPARVGTVNVPRIERFDIVLRTGTLRGRVLDVDTGAGIAGATVSSLAAAGASREVETDASGNYELRDVHAGLVLRMDAHAPLYGRAAIKRTILPTLEAGADLEIDIYMAPTHGVRGVVLGPDGPVGGALVQSLYGGPTTGFERAQATTDPAGEFTLPAVPPGLVVLTPGKDGYFAPEAPDNPYALLMNAETDSPFLARVGGAEPARVELRLERGTAVSGRVLDAAGEPIPGATIGVDPVPGTGRTRTGTDGRFVLNGVDRAKANYVWAGAEGFEPTAVSLRDPAIDSAALELVLPEGATVRGRIRRADGAPVSASQVQVDWWSTPPSLPDGTVNAFLAFPGPEAVASDGSFALRLPARSGAAIIEVLTGGLHSARSAPVDLAAAIAGNAVEIVIPVGEMLSGVIHDDLGSPVSGARVSLKRWAEDDPMRGAAPYGTGVVVVTDELGQFRVEDVAPGNWMLMASADGYAGGANEQLTVPSADPVALTLRRRRSVSGVVELSDGTPIRGAIVAASGATTFTGADGSFTLGGLSGDSADLVVSAGGGLAENILSKSVGDVRTGGQPVRIVVARALSISGVVRDSSGRAVVNAWLELSESGDVAPVATVTSAADGSFRLTGVAAGTYDLAARSESAAPVQRRGISAGATDIDLVLPLGASLHGVVVDDDGHPIANRGLAASWVRPDGSRGGATALTEADGRFRFDGLDDVAIDISVVRRAYGPNYVLTRGRGVTPSAEALRLVASPGGVIAGRVTDARREPVARAQVRLVERDREAGAVIAAESSDPFRTWTDADGRFRFDGLDEHAHRRVIVSPETLAPIAVDSVAPGTNDVEIVVEDGDSASGVVRDTSGDPAAKRRLRITHLASGLTVSAVTDGDGAFTARGLLPGAHSVDVWVPSRPGAPWTTRPCGRLEPGDAAAQLRISE